MSDRLPELLFHGSERAFDKPRGGGYDGVFWTASNSATAQNYIPVSGASVQTAPCNYYINEKVRPRHNDPFTSLAAALGYVIEDATWNHMGEATSFKYPAKGWPTMRDICDHIEQVLGYEPTDGQRGAYRLKMGAWDPETKQSQILPALHKDAGHLYIVTGHEDMKFYVKSTGEGDLTDVQYNHLKSFKQLAAEGYDGVIIDDFAQSKNWGNLGHLSYGFFPSAFDRLKLERIPAVNFDWGDQSKDLAVVDTPEFTRWKAAQVARDLVQAIPSSRSPGSAP